MNGKAKLTVIFILCAVFSGCVSREQLWCPVNCPAGVGNVIVWNSTGHEVDSCIVGQNCPTSPSTKLYTMILFVAVNTSGQLQCGLGSPILQNITDVDLEDCSELEFSTCAYGTPCQVFCPVSANAGYRIWDQNGDEFHPCKSGDCQLSDSWKPGPSNSTILPVHLHAGGIHECRVDGDFGNLKLTYIYMTAPSSEDEIETTPAGLTTTLTPPPHTGAETTTGTQLTTTVPKMAPAEGIGGFKVLVIIITLFIVLILAVIGVIMYVKCCNKKKSSIVQLELDLPLTQITRPVLDDI